MLRYVILTTSGLSILLHDAISLPDAMSCDKYIYIYIYKALLHGRTYLDLYLN